MIENISIFENDKSEYVLSYVENNQKIEKVFKNSLLATEFLNNLLSLNNE